MFWGLHGLWSQTDLGSTSGSALNIGLCDYRKVISTLCIVLIHLSSGDKQFLTLQAAGAL